MIIGPLVTTDIAPLMELAVAEGWVADPWEFEFLLTQFPQGCFTARRENGEAAGFVTSLRHERSGWIGNLIVTPTCRGNGIGSELFRKAMETLLESGVETVWLTASKAGMPLYQKFGFTRIDTIIRWSGIGQQRCSGDEAQGVAYNASCSPDELDCRGWGDRRAELLAVTAGRGRLLQQESGFVVVQPCGDTRQLGPFSALSYGTADALLKTALDSIPFGTSVCLDAPASNSKAVLLFYRNRMRISGSNELMYAGAKPTYKPEYIYGLATMGSCG